MQQPSSSQLLNIQSGLLILRLPTQCCQRDGLRFPIILLRQYRMCLNHIRNAKEFSQRNFRHYTFEFSPSPSHRSDMVMLLNGEDTWSDQGTANRTDSLQDMRMDVEQSKWHSPLSSEFEVHPSKIPLPHPARHLGGFSANSTALIKHQ
ncbi:hypothetical protein E2C01_054436 [Portunus trituberculatus]|uniref:Uncharacterized protein n=1 Tax=Portunus trituberculatus TaxID=210409 RepID=A0A5B7GNN9_PORTR|nr:hypothetical protein [Portunus trituberculatus]